MNAPEPSRPSAPFAGLPLPPWLAPASDFCLWGFILLALVGGTYYLTTGQFKGRQQLIHLHFQDANEIGKGAAVKMMGTDIGYVENIHLKTDYVDVEIKTYPDSLKIPSGSTFTILFTGIVGSKSIEIIPPTSTRPDTPKGPQYLVENPIRLKQALQYQIDIAEALKEGANNFTNMFGNEKPTEILQYNILRARDAVVTGNQYLAEMNTSVKEKAANASRFMDKVNTTLNGFNLASEKLKESSDPRYLEPAIFASLRYISLLLKEGQATMVTFQSAQGFHQVNQKIMDMNQKVMYLTTLPKTRIGQNLTTLQWQMSEFKRAMDTFALAVNPSKKGRLKEIDQKIRDFNAMVEAAYCRIK